MPFKKGTYKHSLAIRESISKREDEKMFKRGYVKKLGRGDFVKPEQLAKLEQIEKTRTWEEICK